jgi:hypothetical protein
VYSRSIGDSILTFAPSGWTYHSTFVLYDYETESIWYPYVDFQKAGETPLVCIAGDFADTTIKEIPSTMTSFKEWYETNPDSKYMDF